MKLIEDLDVYAFRRGLPKWMAVLMPIIYWETWPIIVYRIRNYVYRRVHIPILRQLLYIVGYFAGWVVRFLTTITISEKAIIGKGLFIPHMGNITISHHTTIGDNCVIQSLPNVGPP